MIITTHYIDECAQAHMVSLVYPVGKWVCRECIGCSLLFAGVGQPSVNGFLAPTHCLPAWFIVAAFARLFVICGVCATLCATAQAMVKGESSAVEGVSHKSQAQRLCAYRLKLKCALSTRGAKCFLLSTRRRRWSRKWKWSRRLGAAAERLLLWQICILCELQQICVRSKNYNITRCPAVSLSHCPSCCLALSLSLSLLTHGHGTIYEAFPSETHCKIYFRFIYARNARRNNHTVARRRGSACKSVCVCLGLCG